MVANIKAIEGITEEVVINKVVPKVRVEEVITVVVGLVTKEAVEEGIKEVVVIMVEEVRAIREAVVHIMEIKVDNTKIAVIIKVLKEVTQTNMTIEAKVGDRIVGTREDIAECKGLAGRKTTKTILRFAMLKY